MEFIKTLLNKISPTVKRGIGISVSPMSIMEIVDYDCEMGEIKNYIKTELQYDQILREINVETFEVTLQTLLKKFDISPQTPVILTIPNIFINRTDLPLELESDEIETALTSETEKNYIFKKSEPKISWNIISTDKENKVNTILYTAVQKTQIEKLEAVFKRQGLKLVAIDSAYSSLLRGLSVSGYVDNCIEKNQKWCVLIINNNSNTVIKLNGSQVLDIEEGPLALKSLDTDDLYPSLSSNLLEKLQNHPVESLVIINNTRDINANTLETYFNFKCPTVKIENNYHEGNPVFSFAFDPSKEAISPEVIGASSWKNAPVRFVFNYSNIAGADEVPGFLANMGISGNPLHFVLLGLITVAFLLITAISLICLPINGYLDEQYRNLSVQCAQYKEKFEKPKEKVFDLFDVVQTGFDNNEKFITSFDAVSSVIPEKVWISSINVDENLNASIQGRAYSVEDIVSYYQNLLSVGKFNNFKIKSIKVVGDASGTETPTDVSVNSPSAQPPTAPSTPNSSSSLLPPPPVAGLDSSIASGPKYYEFNLGNPVIVAATTDNKGENGEQKSVIQNFSDIAKNLKLGGNQPEQANPPTN